MILSTSLSKRSWPPSTNAKRKRTASALGFREVEEEGTGVFMSGPPLRAVSTATRLEPRVPGANALDRDVFRDSHTSSYEADSSKKGWPAFLTGKRKRSASVLGFHEEEKTKALTGEPPLRSICTATRLDSGAPGARSLDRNVFGESQTLPSDSDPSGSSRRRMKSIANLKDITQGVQRLLHRASSSVRASTSESRGTATRTASTPMIDMAQVGRPSTSWHHRATSLAHLTRPSSAFLFSPSTTATPSSTQNSRPSVDSHRSFLQPSRSRPCPGAAARAAAAAAAASHNNRHGLGRIMVIRGDSKIDRDAESGIGIEVRGSGEVSSQAFEDSPDVSIVRKDPIGLLPAELSAHILALLDHTSLSRAERVSQAWRHAASSHHVWREVFRNEHNGTWTKARRPSVPFDTTPKGIGKKAPDQDWKRIFAVRKELRAKWEKGNLAAAYVAGHTDSVYCAQFDDDKFITGSRDRTVRVWDIHTFRTIKVLGNPLAPVSDPGLVPAPQTTTADMGVITVQSSFPTAATLGAAVQGSAGSTMGRSDAPMYHDASILCLQFDSQILVTGSSDATCIVWSILEDYQPVRRLQHHTHGVLDVCLDPKRIVTCSKDTTLCVWDRTTGEMLRQMRGHTGPVNAIQMRGNLVVSASGDALIKLWNLDSGKCVREFAGPGRGRGLACVQFSEDSRLIVSGGNDHVIRIWDANTGECLRELEGHTSLVRSLHLDSANGRVISGSYDQSVKVFHLETGDLLIDFPKWTSSWILCTKADYRRIIATSQCGRTFIMDFGKFIDGIEMLEAGAPNCGL